VNAGTSRNPTSEKLWSQEMSQSFLVKMDFKSLKEILFWQNEVEI